MPSPRFAVDASRQMKAVTSDIIAMGSDFLFFGLCTNFENVSLYFARRSLTETVRFFSAFVTVTGAALRGLQQFKQKCASSGSSL